MTIYLDADRRDQIARHGERTYPHEGCGVLIGSHGGDAMHIVDVMTVDNAREDSQRNRYTIAPEDVLRAEREAESRDLSLIGFFHSHPDAPAEPSAYDLDHASWPGLAYVIQSVREGHAQELRAWELSPDRTRFEERDVIQPEPSKGGPAT
ncbi:MAG: Mov34/MPN/PAD-1 family protein [Salinibacter sp.]